MRAGGNNQEYSSQRGELQNHETALSQPSQAEPSAELIPSRNFITQMCLEVQGVRGHGGF